MSYIANVLKCRPHMPPGESGNRPPTPAEMETCLPYLTEQIEIIGPKVLVALGKTAVEGLLKIREPMGELRGRWHSYRETPLMITFHPSYLLRTQSNTRSARSGKTCSWFWNGWSARSPKSSGIFSLKIHFLPGGARLRRAGENVRQREESVLSARQSFAPPTSLT